MARVPEVPPLPERILDATLAALRRHGVEKTNVVDVARALDMSHANIYRHFPSKKALLDAVAGRWLRAIIEPLAAISEDAARPAGERLAAWFMQLRQAKTRKVLDDPELFRVYHGIAESARELVEDHVRELVGQLKRIVDDGVASGEFAPQPDTAATALAFLRGTMVFHHPSFLIREPRTTDAEAKVVLDLLLRGLRAR